MAYAAAVNEPTGEGHLPDTRELPEPADPWAGRAPVPASPAELPPTNTVYVPEIVYVERRRRRKWPWLVAAFALCLVCCGACGALVAPITAQWPAHVSIGSQAGGLQKDAGIAATLIAGEVSQQIRTNISVEGSFAAKLDDPRDKSRWVLFLGATRMILDPGSEMDSAIKSSRNSLQLTDVATYEPGPMGGQLRCGKGRDDHDTRIAVCAWIDHGSEAIGFFYGSWPVNAAAAEMRAIRSDVLSRH
jgi:hypothetical protein